MKISNFYGAIPFAFTAVMFPVAMVYFYGTSAFLYPVPVYILFVICFFLSLFLFWSRGKYYVLNEDGICHMFFGICFRKTTWDEIQDIMRSRNPVQSGPGMALVVTVKGTDVLRQDAFYGTKGFYSNFLPGWMRGKRFVINIPQNMNAEKIVQYVQTQYGPLDFDYFQ